MTSIIKSISSYVPSFTSYPSKQTLAIVVGSVLLIISILWYYNKYIHRAAKRDDVENIENSDASKQAELILFSVDWCPHCKTAKPIWEELKTEYDNKTINGYTVLFTDINCTNETPEIEKMIATYKIEGYPTIKLLKDGKVIEYDAKPSKSTLTEFLNSVL
jgi:thiol-disulfide isomerase/thioredoxin